MKLSYSIDPVARVVEFHYTGSPDFAEWSAVMEAILADPAFRAAIGAGRWAAAVSGPASYGMGSHGAAPGRRAPVSDPGLHG